MQLTLDTGDGAYQIRSYEAGKLVVNDQAITDNVVVSPDKIVLPWPVPNFTDLQLIHLQPLFELTPEIVLLGTGATQQFLGPELLAAFYSKNIGIEVMNTHAACRTYNVLMAEGRRVAAALFL